MLLPQQSSSLSWDVVPPPPPPSWWMSCPLPYYQVLLPPSERGEKLREHETIRVIRERVRSRLSESSGSSQTRAFEQAHPDRAINGRLPREVTSVTTCPLCPVKKRGLKSGQCFLSLSIVACGIFCHDLYCHVFLLIRTLVCWLCAFHLQGHVRWLGSSFDAAFATQRVGSCLERRTRDRYRSSSAGQCSLK